MCVCVCVYIYKYIDIGINIFLQSEWMGADRLEEFCSGRQIYQLVSRPDEIVRESDIKSLFLLLLLLLLGSDKWFQKKKNWIKYMIVWILVRKRRSPSSAWAKATLDSAESHVGKYWSNMMEKFNGFLKWYFWINFCRWFRVRASLERSGGWSQHQRAAPGKVPASTTGGQQRASGHPHDPNHRCSIEFPR